MPRKSVRELRDELEKASESKDKASLERVIEGAERAALPELSSVLRKAREALQQLGGGLGG